MGKKLSSFIKHLKNRPDSEHEQAAIRFIMGSIFLVYILWIHSKHPIHLYIIIAPCVYLFTVIVNFSWIIFNPEVSVIRRSSSMIIDAFGISYLMLNIGEMGTPFFGGYLFSTIGYGFRYGSRYLLTSGTLSIIGFCYVLLHNEYWISQQTLGIGLIITMIAVPLYAGIRLRLLNNAVQYAEFSNQAKSKLLASMSHEIKTPLNSIIGVSDFMLKTSLDDEQKRYGKTIHDSAKNLLTIVDDVLDLNNIETGKTKIEDIDFDLHSLIHNTINMFSTTAQGKGLRLVTHISPEIPFQLSGDALHLRQILMNLISNAIEGSGAGQIELYVEASSLKKEQQDNIIQLLFKIITTTVRNGTKKIKRVLESGETVSIFTSHLHEKQNLNTIIAKNLTKQMNGEFTYVGDPPNKRIYTCKLPFKVMSSVVETPDLSNLTILHIGSKDSNEKIQYLYLWGAKVFETTNECTALQILNQESTITKPIDLIIVDKKSLQVSADSFPLMLKKNSHADCPALILIGDIKYKQQGYLLKSGYFCILNDNHEQDILFNAVHAACTNKIQNQNVIKFIDHYVSQNREPLSQKILIAEDNPTEQKIIEKALIHGGHSVYIVANGEEALTAMESQDFDLVILDNNMPLMGGIETAKQIRFLYPEKKDLPILMISIEGSSETIRECEIAGIDVHITKPVEPGKLLQTITALTAKKRNKTKTSNIAAPTKLIKKHSGPIVENHYSIDHSILNKLSSINKHNNFINDLVNSYLHDNANALTTMQYAIHDTDFKTLRNISHKLVGSAKSIGATKLAKLYIELNQLANERNINDADDCMNKIIDEFEDTRSELISFLEQKNTLIH